MGQGYNRFCTEVSEISSAPSPAVELSVSFASVFRDPETLRLARAGLGLLRFYCLGRLGFKVFLLDLDQAARTFLDFSEA